MKADEFDEWFDSGEDMAASLDTARARRPGEEHKRVNVDFPVWMIAELDREATRLGVTRQSLIKVWIAEKLDHGGHTVAFVPREDVLASGKISQPSMPTDSAPTWTPWSIRTPMSLMPGDR